MTTTAEPTRPVRRILAALDGSPLAEAILDPVRVLATRLGADVVLCHVVAVPEVVRTSTGEPTIEVVLKQERSRAEAYLEAAAQRLRSAGIAVRTVTTVGDAAAEVLRSAEGHHADLVAIATHGRSGVRRWLYGSVADAIIHSATKPVLLLRPADTPQPPFDIRRVVVGLDGSPIAEAALATAEDIARRFDAPLMLVRVVETSTLAFAGDPAAAIYVDYQRPFDLLHEGAERYLEERAAEVRRRGLNVETVVATGSSADELVAQSRVANGALLVLGTHGRSGWRAAALGSVARRVALLASSPVLLVRGAEPSVGHESTKS